MEIEEGNTLINLLKTERDIDIIEDLIYQITNTITEFNYVYLDLHSFSFKIDSEGSIDLYYDEQKNLEEYIDNIEPRNRHDFDKYYYDIELLHFAKHIWYYDENVVDMKNINKLKFILFNYLIEHFNNCEFMDDFNVYCLYRKSIKSAIKQENVEDQCLSSTFSCLIS